MYAKVIIATSVIPGLMLTGDVKMLNAGVVESVGHLRPKVIASVLANLPVAAVSFWLTQPHFHIIVLLILTLIGTFGSTAQAFSSVWYYTQPNKARLLRNKIFSASVKVTFAGFALAYSELTYALVGISLGALVEFSFNYRSLPWGHTSSPAWRRNLVSYLGVAYAISRLVSAAVRLGLSQLLGPLVASLLIIEQLIGGINSIFEKYFSRSKSFWKLLQIVKIFYLFVMMAVVPWLIASPPQAGTHTSLAWLILLACAGLLPLADMYSALERRGQNFVALGTISISLLCGLGLMLAAWEGYMGRTALVMYIAMPGAAFLFYWIASIDDRHNSKH
jgi:hypothetical protein